MSATRLFTGLRDAYDETFRAAASPLPLAYLRMLLAAVLLAQGVALLPYLPELFSRHAFLNGPLLDYLVEPGRARLVGLLTSSPATERFVLRADFTLYLVSLFFFLLGWHTRIFTVVLWISYKILYSSGPLSVYGVDHYVSFVLFYLMAMPAGHALSLDRAQGRVRGEPTQWANLSIQLLRAHLTLTYLAAGWGKLMGEQWRSGEAIWRALNIPTYSTFDMGWLAWHPCLAKALCWGTIALELGYPLWLWNRRIRPVGVVAILLLHLGIAIAMGLVSFGALMAVLNLALFGSPLLGTARAQLARLSGYVCTRAARISMRSSTAG